MTTVARLARQERTLAVLRSLDCESADRVMSMAPSVSREDAAATDIQRVARGRAARRRYVQLLLAKFEEDERERQERQARQVREGETLLEMYVGAWTGLSRPHHSSLVLQPPTGEGAGRSALFTPAHS